MLLCALWLILGVLFLHRLRLPRSHFLVCCGVLVLALVLRFLGMDHITSDYTDFLSNWVEFFRLNGGFLGLRHSVGDYNVPYLYLLAAISYFPVSDLYLIKLVSIFADLLLAFAGLRLARRVFQSETSAAVAFCALLLLPTVVLNGSCWGQCDSLYGALALLALADALDGHGARSVVWLGVSFSFKLQAVFLIPLWCALWFCGRVKLRHLFLFPLSYFATILPALLLGKPLWDILGVYFNQMGLYNDRLTLNAPSLYALIPTTVTLDAGVASKAGVVLAFLVLAILLLWLFWQRRQLTDQAILTAAALMVILIPLCLPHMHERYFFLADCLAVVWATGSLRRVLFPALVQVASLGGYYAYLCLEYLFPLSWGAALLIAAAVVLVVCLPSCLAISPKLFD